jgi:hypothetical protein
LRSKGRISASKVFENSVVVLGFNLRETLRTNMGNLLKVGVAKREYSRWLT